ncbi:DOG1 domain-containing protein [Forsythia ovata]|uniref:DOG1 domain-containing protein n=1 Tax=Forsythia ovata TaxID=205694 RepID=A0ABD1QBU9_9LAMI
MSSIGSLDELSARQLELINNLQSKTIQEESKLSSVVASLQENIADMPIAAIASKLSPGCRDPSEEANRALDEYMQSMQGEDVLPFFAPVWLSPLENAYLWITGWKQSIAFELIDPLTNTQTPGATQADMRPTQVKKIEALREKIKAEEETVEKEMELQQVAVADRRMVKLAMVESRVRNS